MRRSPPLCRAFFPPPSLLAGVGGAGGGGREGGGGEELGVAAAQHNERPECRPLAKMNLSVEQRQRASHQIRPALPAVLNVWMSLLKLHPGQQNRNRVISLSLSLSPPTTNLPPHPTPPQPLSRCSFGEAVDGCAKCYLTLF